MLLTYLIEALLFLRERPRLTTIVAYSLYEIIERERWGVGANVSLEGYVSRKVGMANCRQGHAKVSLLHHSFMIIHAYTFSGRPTIRYIDQGKSY